MIFVWWGRVKPLLASQSFVRDEVGVALAKNIFVNHEARKILAQQVLASRDPEFVTFSVPEMSKGRGTGQEARRGLACPGWCLGHKGRLYRKQ